MVEVYCYTLSYKKNPISDFFQIYTTNKQWRSQTLVVEGAIYMGLMGRGGGESMQIFFLSYLSNVKFLGMGGAIAPIAPPWLRH